MGLESKFKKYFKWFKLVFKTDTLKKNFLEPEFWTKVPKFKHPFKQSFILYKKYCRLRLCKNYGPTATN